MCFGIGAQLSRECAVDYNTTRTASVYSNYNNALGQGVDVLISVNSASHDGYTPFPFVYFSPADRNMNRELIAFSDAHRTNFLSLPLIVCGLENSGRAPLPSAL